MFLLLFFFLFGHTPSATTPSAGMSLTAGEYTPLPHTGLPAKRSTAAVVGRNNIILISGVSDTPGSNVKLLPLQGSLYLPVDDPLHIAAAVVLPQSTQRIVTLL